MVGEAEAQEQQVEAVRRQVVEAGLLELVWQRFWAGCVVVGVGQGCALLGRQASAGEATLPGSCCGGDGPAAQPPPVLPWYLVRAGGGAQGWAALHAALARPASGTAAAAGLPSGLVGVGVLAGGCWLVDPATGLAEMLAAPSRDALVATAAWTARPDNDPALAGLQEADAGWEFFCELGVQGLAQG